MGTPRTIVSFHFQQIPLEEAINAVMAGDGNYAVLKAKLLDVLPSLPEGKAFAFGLPEGKEIEEDQRRGICMALNKTLHKAKVPWRVTYSSFKKLFVCVPESTSRTYKSKSGKDESSSPPGTLSIEDIESAACKTFNISPNVLRGQTIDREASKIRKAVVYLAARRYGWKLGSVAKYYGLSTSSLYGINQDAKKIHDTIKRLEAAL